ncbi:MAG: xanthine phosphoribosyltransferase [Alphaproteobacteria bacterium]|nr:xanthine phosphoribosyltransferase [Alphaproteobacteria bacterium]
MDKLYITWDDFHRDAKRLCDKIKKLGKFDRIIAVSRGGLIPAGIISYEMDIRNVEAVSVSSYDGENLRDFDEIKISISVDNVDEKTLVIDDLADTGNTFKLLRSIFPKAKYVCVYAKDAGKPEADAYQEEMPNKWIVFPWD